MTIRHVVSAFEDVSRWSSEFVVAVAVLVPALRAVRLVLLILLLLLLLVVLLVLLTGLMILGSRFVIPVSVWLTLVVSLGGECLWLI